MSDLSVTTPSGIVITFTERPRRYFIDNEQVPSVTHVLDILDKPALKWWSFKTGIEAVCELADRYAWKEDGLPKSFGPERLIEWAKREKLTINSVSGRAAERGQAIHKALERLMEGELPDPREFPLPDRGYVQALKAWFEENGPTLLAKEVLVASAEHKFAGRFDLHAELLGKTVRLDLKTAKGIYPEMFLQIEAYEFAAVESGYEPSDFRLILRLAPDGSHEMQRSHATAGQFLSVLGCYRDVEALRNARVAA